MNISWYVKRLLAMSPREVVSRFVFLVKKKSWKKKALIGSLFNNCLPIKNRQCVPCVSFHIDITQPHVGSLLEEADLYIKHGWNFFGLNNIAEQKINWHYDPTTDITAPRKFSFCLNYRDTGLVGNVKVIWEKNRHHHLTVMSAAYFITQDERYAAEVVRQILDWINNNPCGIGINWTHGLEMSVRLIAWVWCERLLRGSQHYDELFGNNSPIWLCIGRHQELIERTYSYGSSANNHLIGEMAGLFIASSAFPIYKKSRHWNELSKKVLEQEIARQTYPSGINKELAFDYHVFVSEFFLLSQYEANKCGADFSGTFLSILARMVAAIQSLTDTGHNLPRYGDGDDGMALQLQARSGNRDTWLCELASMVLGSTSLYSGPATLPVMLMGLAPDVQALTKQLPKQPESFPDAGFYILSHNRNTKKEIFVLADAGPLGYLSIAAHGHADALSFTLSAGGKGLLVDPGTYEYFTGKEWRNYFRGTSAHNTVLINNKDQSRSGGPFLWLDKANVTVKEWKRTENKTILTAQHDGYAHGLGVIHQRTLELSGNVLSVADLLSGTGEHTAQLCFHCDPLCSVAQEQPNRVVIINDGVTVIMTIPDELSVSLHRGEQRAGWYSPCFGVKIPAYTIFAGVHCTLPVTFTTTIEVQHGS